METTPDKYCTWKVTNDNLHDSLGEIHRNGSTVVSCVPSELELARNTPSNLYIVVVYIIIYYNPATQVIPGIPGSGAPATLQ